MDLIEGRQPVREALRAGRAIGRILIAQGTDRKGALGEIITLAAEAGISVETVPRSEIDARARTRVHQGVLAEAAPFRSRSWWEGVERARATGRAPLLLALDGITDPHNAGALIRSAEVFGADAVLLPKRRAAPITPTVEKASAGATEHLVIDVVSNLERALADCKQEGLWVVSLAADAEQAVDACDLLEEPVVIVVGSEGTGVSRLIRERSDAVVAIPTLGRVDSLNASVAGAICLWEAARRRARATRG